MTLEPNLEATLTFIAAAAKRGDRAPTNGQILSHLYTLGLDGGGGDNPVSRLCLLGYLISWIYGHNWRVIEIVKGEHAGAVTRAHPVFTEAYIRTDRNGVHRLTIQVLEKIRGDAAPRACLKCKKTFKARGSHRICPRCTIENRSIA